MTDRLPKTIAVTGAARGIGLETAKACSDAGMKVAIGDLDGDAAEAAAKLVGGGAVGFSLDVTDEASFSTFLEASERELGPLEGIVNNAGVLFLGPYAEETEAHTQAMVEVNVLGVMRGTRLALNLMQPRGFGRIVNIASLAGQSSVAGGATYSATKHAVVGFTRSIRAEVAGTGVSTMLVMPGVIETEMTHGFQKARAARSLGPDEVAAGIIKGMRGNKQEIFIPLELAGLARGLAGAPPKLHDGIKSLMKIDEVMGKADRSARVGYESGMDR